MSDSGSDNESVELTEEQLEQRAEELNKQILEVFLKYDTEHTDYMPAKDFKLAMEDLGDKINEKQCYNYMMQADPLNEGKISYESFKNLVIAKRASERSSSTSELMDAFIALGGEEGGEGCVDADKLIQIIKHDFQMTIDIEALIREVDEDGSGEIEFDEFQELLGGKVGTDDPTEQDSGEEESSSKRLSRITNEEKKIKKEQMKK